MNTHIAFSVGQLRKKLLSMISPINFSLGETGKQKP